MSYISHKYTNLNNNDNLTYIILSYIEQYGFERFIEVLMKEINMKHKKNRASVAAAVSEPIDETRNFRQIFKFAVNELMKDEGMEYEEALEYIANDNYVIPTDIAMSYSMNSDEGDINTLSELMRAKAETLLEKLT